MGKNIIKIEDANITGIYSNEQISVMNHYKDQPNNGPTIYCFKNPNTEITRTAFVDKSHLYEYDEETDFYWEFGYNNGHPCVFITFYGISQTLRDNGILCLETNTQIRRKRNKSINVFEGEKVMDEYNGLQVIPKLKFSTHEITWFFCSDLELNTQYCLYIKGKTAVRWFGSKDVGHSIIGPWRIALRNFPEQVIPDDYYITLNIRPTFRIAGTFYDRPYSNYKAKAEYKHVGYYLKQEI